MKKFLIGIALMIAMASNASAFDMIDCYTDDGWNQNFGLTTQMENGYLRCTSSMDKRHYLRFDGFGPGIGIGVEALKLVYIGPGEPDGEFYGVRAEAAFIVGMNVMVAVGKTGMIYVVGVDFGVGFDPSMVKIVIGKDYSEIRRKEDKEYN